MKICQYCDTLNPDDAPICSGCGASAFFHKCANCGHPFEGLLCPECGVRADAEPVKCPSCGRTYFSFSCPHCGYSPQKERQRAYELEKARAAALNRSATTSYTVRPPAESPRRNVIDVTAENEPAPKKKKHTLLWVLGWVFIFPLPLTILLMRKKSGCFGTLLKLALIVFAWLVYACALAQQ